MICPPKGKELWDKLGEGLPKPIGVLYDDESQVQEFAKRFEEQPKKHQKILICWIKQQLDDIERYAPELITGRYEEWERRQKQIYRHHLEAIGSL